MPHNSFRSPAEHCSAVNFQRIFGSSLAQRVFAGTPLGSALEQRAIPKASLGSALETRVFAGVPLAPALGPSLPPEERGLPDTFVRITGRRALVDPTKPTPLVDLSDKRFNRHVRPDGQAVLIEEWGDICIPDRLIPGGVEMPPLAIEGSSLTINVFGDTGKGTDEQLLVARNISAMADERGAQVTVHVGDIIYPSGILTPSDPRVRSLLLEPYASLREKHICWGNHEYGNSRAAGVPEAWLEVAKAEDPRTFAQPSRYYSRRFLVDGMTVRAVFLDSSTVAVDPAQLAWARSELEKPADMRIVFGHHPIYSGGLHGSLPHMEKLLLPMLEQHADLYCCGHEHNLQFLRSAAGFPLVVSGAAGEERTAWRKPQTEFFSGHMGTTFLRIDRSGIEIEMRDGRSRKTLFTKHVPRRNNG